MRTGALVVLKIMIKSLASKAFHAYIHFRVNRLMRYFHERRADCRELYGGSNLLTFKTFKEFDDYFASWRADFEEAEAFFNQVGCEENIREEL